MFMHSRVLFWCLFLQLQNNELDKQQKTLKYINNSSQQYILKKKFSYWFIFHNESVNEDQKDIFYTLIACLTQSVTVLVITTSQSITRYIIRPNNC